MQALHDDDLDAGLGVVEAGGEGAVVPVEHPRAGAVAQRFLELVRVVDDDDVAALAGRLAADRGREPVAGLRVLVAVGAVDVGLQLELGPALPVPAGAEQVAAPDRVALGQAGAVARGQEPDVGRERPEPGRPHHRDGRSTSCAAAAR